MAIERTHETPHPEWTMGGNPGAIERQEAEGQKQLAASSQLPRRMINQGFGANETDLRLSELVKRLGIVVVGPSPRDPIFYDVALPIGWQITPTTHSMWSDLIDSTGARMAQIFYKAAFYDRNAFISFERDVERRVEQMGGTQHEDKAEAPAVTETPATPATETPSEQPAAPQEAAPDSSEK